MPDPDDLMRRREDDPEGDEQQGLQRWLRPYFTDSTLWPVLFVAVAVLVLIGATGILLAVPGRSPFALGALLVAAIASSEAILAERRAGGLGLATGFVISLWILSGLVALAADLFGLF